MPVAALLVAAVLLAAACGEAAVDHGVQGGGFQVGGSRDTVSSVSGPPASGGHLASGRAEFPTMTSRATRTPTVTATGVARPTTGRRQVTVPPLPTTGDPSSLSDPAPETDGPATDPADTGRSAGAAISPAAGTPGSSSGTATGGPGTAISATGTGIGSTAAASATSHSAPSGTTPSSTGSPTGSGTAPAGSSTGTTGSAHPTTPGTTPDRAPGTTPDGAPSAGPSTPPARPLGPPPIPAPYRHVLGWTGSGKVVSLTFDDGPGPYTAQILDILEAKKVPATFCQIGEQVADYPQIEKRIAADGFLLCNHSWDHDEDLSQRSPGVIDREMSRTGQAIKSVAGVEPVYYRAPGGDFGDPVKRAAARQHLPLMAWAVDPRDWARPGVDAIVQAVLDQVTPGAIILLHDAGGDRSQTVAALPRVIDGLRARGYTFTTPPRHPQT